MCHIRSKHVTASYPQFYSGLRLSFCPGQLFWWFKHTYFSLKHFHFIIYTCLFKSVIVDLTLDVFFFARRVKRTNSMGVYRSHLELCRLRELPKVAILATKLNLFQEPILLRITKKVHRKENFQVGVLNIQGCQSDYRCMYTVNMSL